MKQIMLDLIHPASNEILLIINRGGPKDDKDWAAVRHSALTLNESGALLLRRAPAHDLAEWAKDARMLADAGAAAYKAAQAKEASGLAAYLLRRSLPPRSCFLLARACSDRVCYGY